MPVDSHRGPVMRERRPVRVEQPVVPLERRVARRADGAVASWSDSCGCPRCTAISPRGASGPASAARPACPATGSDGAAAREERAAGHQRRARAPRWRARAAATPSDAARRSRLAMQHVPRRAGHERGERAQPRGPVSGGRHQAVARLQGAATAPAPSCRRLHATCPTATSPTSRPTTTRCRRRARRPTRYDEIAAGAGAGRRPAAQHRAVHRLPRRHRPEARRAVARRDAQGVSRRAAQAFPDGSRRNDSQAQMRNMARAMTDAEIEEVPLFYAGKASAGGER